MTIRLERSLVLAIHEEQLAAHGGASGIRDEGLLESALARRLNHASYGETDVVQLAALYAIAIARNHPFVDGNKRTAFVALEAFLILNGCRFPATDAEVVVAMLAMASGEMPDEDFTGWVRQHAGVTE